MAYCILRTAKLKALTNVAASLRHTFRDRPTPNADPAKRAQNEPIDGRNAAEVLADIQDRIPRQRRRDAVLCVEYLIGASPEFFDNGETGAAYFDAARWWLIDLHGADNVIFSAVHRDETSPHLVAYVVPIHAGRLSAKHWLGGKAKLSTLQTDFAKAVGQRFGLERCLEGSTARHTTVKQFYSAINAPPPALPHVEVTTPPMFGRGGWAKNEAASIAETLRPVLTDAARVSGSVRFLERERRQAQATAKHQANKVRAALVEVEKLRGANKRLRQALAEWTATFNAGLTDEQAEALVALADTMREANQREVKALPARPSSHAPNTPGG